MSTKTRYSDTELAEFKAIIEEKLVMAQDQLVSYMNQINGTAAGADEKVRSIDDGNISVDNDRLITMAARQKKHIRSLDNALLRIENKVYGVCRVTGNLIQADRLRAVPHATLSIDAKETKGKPKRKK